jgi:2-oxoglutarate ferredoxin oxidoreductase subunit delta
MGIQKEKRNRKGYFTAVCTDGEICVGCAFCAVMCPDCAIEVEKNSTERLY